MTNFVANDIIQFVKNVTTVNLVVLFLKSFVTSLRYYQTKM